MNTVQLDVRTFSSMEEIRQSISNFVDDNPLSQATYKRLIGDYVFADEVCCCFLKANGKLCGEPHRKGWVAELHDGSATIIGNHCAKEKFGAESKFIADRSRYLNEQRLKRLISAIHRQIEEKDDRLARLAQLRSKLQELEAKVKGFVDNIGTQTLWSLESMQRSGNPEVRIKLVKIRETTDERGHVTQERSSYFHSLGQLIGLDVIQTTSFSNIYRAIKAIEWAYRDAEKLDQKPKSKEIESLAARLNEYDGIVRNGNQLLELERDFFDNRFLLLCFLSRDKGERFKSAKIAMRQAGFTGNKDTAKTWLSEQEKLIREQLNADAIELI